jgi:aminoglycoside 2''-phosphotransferase
MEALDEMIQTIYSDHPQFRNTPLQVNSTGWDNLVLIMDEWVIFRIPRDEVSRRQLQVELHFLPQIAAVSPLPVPMYTYFSKEAGLYAGYELIHGEPFTRDVFEKCTKKQQKKIAKLLGVFQSALHSLHVDEAITANVHVRRQNRQTWRNLQAEVLNKAANVLEPIHKQKIEEMFDYILNEISFDAIPKTLIHGDLSSDHIIYDPSRNNLSGIIDFGDLMIGDAAYDFTGILLEYGSSFLDEVLVHYSPPLEVNYLERIEKFYIPKIPVHQLLYGIQLGDEGIVAQALRDLS